MIFDNSDKKIGLITRPITKGVEYDLVERYIESIKKKFYKNDKKSISLFVEPKIDGGYPDLVIVEYTSDPIYGFREQGHYLENKDLKILYECMRTSGYRIQELSSLLGFTFAEVDKSIVKLLEVGLLRINSHGRIYANSLIIKKSISKIIAIEAKIDKWQEALEQASKNLWFATESYIMLNKENCNDNILEQCKRHGVGIILVNGKISKILKSNKTKFPVSYGSLVFWEWIIRKGAYDGKLKCIQNEV